MSFEPDDIGPGPSDFVALLRARAQPTGAGAGGAFTFLGDGADARLGFAELDLRARAIAARLQAEGLGGGRALLIFPPGLEFLPAFFGCLYAGVVAVPAYPPRPNRPMTRLRGIAADASPRAVLTASSLLAEAPRWFEGVPELAGSILLATDAIEGPAGAWREPAIGPDSLAFLQYTSGSTAAAKGVKVSHGNLMANSAAIRRAFGSTAQSRGVSWLPLHHDMGLIGGALQTIYCGGSSVLMSPVSFLQRPFRWLEAISRAGATISGGPNFAYDLCARKVTDDQRATLDLSRWSVAFNGAEPIRAETLGRFAEAFAPCGFRPEAFLPCYGLAEATLLVAGGPPSRPTAVFDLDPHALARGEVVDSGEPKARRLVGSGPVIDGHAVAIVDPEAGLRLPEGRIGEIWVSGPGVAGGYWGDPGPSSRAFGASLPGEEGPFLRTGDLGFLRDGELVVAGRLKDLIIVRGRNVYPQDVEWTVGRCHPSLLAGSGAAFSVEVDGEERLVVAHEVERRSKDAGPILAAIRAAVAADHDLELHAIALLKPMGLPRTSSGKVQRGATREGFLSGTLDVVASWADASAPMAESRRVGEPGAKPTISSTSIGRWVSPRLTHPTAETLSSGGDTSRTSAEIASWLASKLAGPLGIPAEEVDPRKPFATFGLGSLRAVEMAGDLERWLGRAIPPTSLYDHPTIDALARHLAGEPAEAVPSPISISTDDRVAIIGIGCRFPGADGPAAFWRLLADGVDAVGPLPEGRRADFAAPARTRAGFLDRVDGFDAEFFGISPREAGRMDPQQRLLLEVAWEALEDSGQVPDRLAGGKVGVFVGISTNDYGRLLGKSGASSEGYALTGNAPSIAANRISYTFDFRGPSLAVDTACSSSLVAAHLACRSLASGESDLALAGGVNLILAPEILANFEQAGFLAPDGRCKTFDASADGYVRGEGAGVVVLKSLARAEADGDPILAVIRGGAVNQDGRSNGLTAPSRDAQEAVLLAACRAAGVAPERVDYVEAHGTGTLLGDPIEAHALGSAFGAGREGPLLIGSAKTNIGHLEAAAGIAGLIKVALSLRNGTIPPSLHFRDPNPHIPFDSLGLQVVTGPTPWPARDRPGLAGVSSFGFGGTNAHVILEAFEPAAAEGIESSGPHLLPISAKGPAALRDLARRYASTLAGSDLAGVANAAMHHRSGHDHRLALVAGSSAEAIEQLEAYGQGEIRPGVFEGRKSPGRRPRLAFVFSGQGSSSPGSGLGPLLAEPAFRLAFEAVDRAVLEVAGWSILDEVEASPSRLADPGFTQPALFALQVALAALWRSWGVTPDAVIGHSLGEVAAAHVAGALSLADAAGWSRPGGD